MLYADDATGGGKLKQLRRGCDKVNEFGPAFGYFPNAVKTWLVGKDQLAPAKEFVSRLRSADYNRWPPTPQNTNRDS